MTVSPPKGQRLKPVYVLQDIDGGVQCVTTSFERCQEIAALYSPAERNNLFIRGRYLFEDEDPVSDPRDKLNL